LVAIARVAKELVTFMTRKTSLPANVAMQDLLRRTIPGNSPAIQRVRDDVLDFAASVTAKAILIKGPIGVGKSTVARLIGFLKRVTPLQRTEAERLIGDLRFDETGRIDIRSIPWFVELALTGLVETLAESQLFGAVLGAYTGATRQRQGVFELAMTGRSGRGPVPASARLTGGVVFLDEIGELSHTLQTKLLPVLSGGVFYRLGGEGSEDHALEFRGVTITASWRELGPATLRPDLLSRIAPYILTVPSLDERREDFDALLSSIEANVIDLTTRYIDALLNADRFADREYWPSRKTAIAPLSRDVRRQLAGVDWSRYGNLRGVTAAVERIVSSGTDVHRVIDELAPITAGDEGRENSAENILDVLLQRTADGQGLVGHVRAAEVQFRRDLRDRLLDDAGMRRRLSQQLDIPQPQLLTQIHQLARRRRAQKEH
jgi:transcriptional regulator with AAA-type ATPase domain